MLRFRNPSLWSKNSTCSEGFSHYLFILNSITLDFVLKVSTNSNCILEKLEQLYAKFLDISSSPIFSLDLWALLEKVLGGSFQWK